ncbi:DNA cytosine methyltransferase [Clostridium sartagoforme]|uniref:Cytosine-specific methyltransferase n=1 Tax=Clostridium sartagoforme TaxID=84031 RepID=A0A4S2DLB4_9CLOT|nr:DNA cytosine methyltransferase [Clostridium sartagoforme]TGY41784.1 DNA cytosine methyltransferase [Clostridium sartagoforme]
MKTYNVIDLFCGVGGFSYGFKKAGFNMLLGIDNNIACMETYKKNIVTDFLEADISTLTINKITEITKYKNVDIVIGSPPCQDYSPSNPNKKTKTSTINFLQNSLQTLPLSYHFFRLVLLLHPKLFILENHPNLFRTEDFNFINKLFNFFGYKTKLNKIHTEEFGIPQKRHRGFFIGNNLGIDFDLKDLCNTTFPLISLEEAIGDLKTLTPIKSNDLNIKQTIPPQNFSSYQILMHNSDVSIYNNISPFNKPDTIEILKTLKSGEYYKSNQYHIRSHPYDVSKVITRKFNTPSGDGETMHYELPRCLTCREAARIQTFADNFIFYDDNISNIRLQIGNAVPPLLAQQFAEKIKDKLDMI